MDSYGSKLGPTIIIDYRLDDAYKTSTKICGPELGLRLLTHTHMSG